MAEQSNSAAERSAHVTRGAARASENILAEVAPGVFKLKPLVEAEREIERLRAERDRLREALDGVMNSHGEQLHDAFAVARAALEENRA